MKTGMGCLRVGGDFKKMTNKNAKKGTKKSTHPFKNLKFCMKNEKRPTYRDYEKKNLDPQLYQIFKPIRKFSCTFLLI